MKRIIAFLVSVFVVTVIPMFAMSEGYGSNSGYLEDTLDDTASNPYVVTNNDFENATGRFATPDNGDDSINFGLYDSAEKDHDMVFMVEPRNYAAVDKGASGVTYTYNDKTYTAFNETLKANTYYMYSFDYKSILTDKSKLNNGSYFSFAPKVDAYLTANGDWKNYIPGSVDKWSSYSGVLNTGSNTSFYVKLNNEGTYTTSYIDNFYVVELAKINLTSPNTVKLDTNGTGVIYNDLYNAYFAIKGQEATIRVLSMGAGESVAEVTHSSQAVAEKNNAYYIELVTNEIKVDFSFSKAKFEATNGVVVNENNLYVQMGKTMPQVVAQWGISPNNVELKDAAGNVITNLVSPIISGSSFALNYGGEIASYTLKYFGDINGSNTISVSDVIALTETIMSGSYKNYADINGSGKCTVSDVVVLRKMILYPPSTTELPDKFRVLGIGNSFSVDGMEYLYDVAKAYGYEDEDIELGNLYIGGCSLATHWGNASGNAAAYQYYRYDTAQKVWKYSNNATMLSGITDEDWDFISLQQVSQNSGQTETFSPYLQNLIDYVNANKTNPNAKLIWHSTWAYAKDSTHSGFSNYNKNQDTMFNAILEAGQHVLTNYAADIEFIIPSGTAIQNMRTAVGDNLNRDGYHLDLTYGRLTASITWFKTITGANLEGMETDPKLLAICGSGVDTLKAKGVVVTAEELLKYALASANAAVENPYNVTEIK